MVMKEERSGPLALEEILVLSLAFNEVRPKLTLVRTALSLTSSQERPSVETAAPMLRTPELATAVKNM